MRSLKKRQHLSNEVKDATEVIIVEEENGAVITEIEVVVVAKTEDLVRMKMDLFLKLEKNLSLEEEVVTAAIEVVNEAIEVTEETVVIVKEIEVEIVQEKKEQLNPLSNSSNDIKENRRFKF